MKKLSRIDPTILASNPRASFLSWTKFEPIVLSAYKQHPQTYTFKPTNMSPASVASKLRDAIRGKLAFNYPSELNNLDLTRWYDEVIIRHDKENIYIGPKEAIASTLRGESKTKSSELIFSTLLWEEIHAFMLLVSNGRIEGPVIITSPPNLDNIPSRPNVELLHRPDGSLVIL